MVECQDEFGMFVGAEMVLQYLHPGLRRSERRTGFPAVSMVFWTMRKSSTGADKCVRSHSWSTARNLCQLELFAAVNP